MSERSGGLTYDSMVSYTVHERGEPPWPTREDRRGKHTVRGTRNDNGRLRSSLLNKLNNYRNGLNEVDARLCSLNKHNGKFVLMKMFLARCMFREGHCSAGRSANRRRLSRLTSERCGEK